jgi:hypothetical protein
VHSRRARPTLRLLAEDLTADWTSPRPRRLLVEGRFDELHPLSELPHPIIAKAAESFGMDATADNNAGLIVSSNQLHLLEIRAGQWRGGVWQDEESGVHWLVAAGLAKGEHQDRDDFYQRVQRENDSGASTDWLPTEDDVRLLKRETAARLVTVWELDIQKRLLDTLRRIHSGGTARIDIPHPVRAGEKVCVADIEVVQVRDEGYQADEITLEILAERAYAGSDLVWNLTLRALTTLSPPEQGWDRYKDTYSTIAEPGYFAARVTALEALVAGQALEESVPGQHAHFTHRRHLAGNTIEGKAVRALCGAYFVPTQDHDSLPCCPTCRERLDDLPSGPADDGR